MEPVAVTLASILSDVGSIVTAAIGWIGDYVSAIAGSPLLLLFVIVPICGLGIGLIKRMISL